MKAKDLPAAVVLSIGVMVSGCTPDAPSTLAIDAVPDAQVAHPDGHDTDPAHAATQATGMDFPLPDNHALVDTAYVLVSVAVYGLLLWRGRAGGEPPASFARPPQQPPLRTHAIPEVRPPIPPGRAFNPVQTHRTPACRRLPAALSSRRQLTLNRLRSSGSPASPV